MLLQSSFTVLLCLNVLVKVDRGKEKLYCMLRGLNVTVAKPAHFKGHERWNNMEMTKPSLNGRTNAQYQQLIYYSFSFKLEIKRMSFLHRPWHQPKLLFSNRLLKMGLKRLKKVISCIFLLPHLQFNYILKHLHTL